MPVPEEKEPNGMSEEQGDMMQPQADSAAEGQMQPDQALQPAPDPEPAAGQAENTGPETDANADPVQEPEPEVELLFDANGPTVLTPEMVKRANRTRVVMIVVLVLLVAALAALGYLAYQMFSSQNTSTPAVDTAPVAIEDPIKDNTASAPVEAKAQTTTIPNLSSLFGLTVAEAQTRLNGEFTLKGPEAKEDATNPAIKFLATLTYSPKSSAAASPASSTLSENIYLSLDENSKIIQVYYVCSMDLLGIPESSFAALTADSQTVDNILSAAGVTPEPAWAYVVPTAASFTEYVDPAAEQLKVKKETAKFNSATANADVPPANWSLSLTYDYGASGVVMEPDTLPSQRTLYLQLF